ncbi:hypothetical protein QNI19_02940 [Cytophagaceae bacterium DM2B3-1]|uniref:Uncharacterized protein n=1 Tax=Xanthocytophaga flava TaxID=3048013 RepID=A0ABT7CFM3_9BACT|nr:hypothetical protein [Xanthocytophaga flavus]MDJ1472692.1 hypothetical protein [Xanthocytophaga flavus]MDJ1491872.1 hypothetical protein [Xanthocytophaga flavus]
MRQNLLDIILLNSVKFMLKDREAYSLFCDYLRKSLACHKVASLPISLSQIRKLHQAKEQLEIIRELLDVTLQFNADLRSYAPFIIQLETLPANELERLLEIYDETDKPASGSVTE